MTAIFVHYFNFFPAFIFHKYHVLVIICYWKLKLRQLFKEICSSSRYLLLPFKLQWLTKQLTKCGLKILNGAQFSGLRKLLLCNGLIQKCQMTAHLPAQRVILGQIIFRTSPARLFGYTDVSSFSDKFYSKYHIIS